MSVTCQVSASLALIKYWGKADTRKNIPATSSLGLTVNALQTECTLSFAQDIDCVQIDGALQPMERFTPFFNNLRKSLRINHRFRADSVTSFPIAAGLASSSSGFAALAYGAAALCHREKETQLISELARVGSASAARAVIHGFSILEKGQTHAAQLLSAQHWPELRVLIAILSKAKKKVSSRAAMERARHTSPLYKTWLDESEKLYQESLAACKKKDFIALGEAMRKSYLMMFSTMFTSAPPILFWQPETIGLIKECENLRQKGYRVFETIDAGPQVKLLCLEEEALKLQEILEKKFPQATFLLSHVGIGPAII